MITNIFRLYFIILVLHLDCFVKIKGRSGITCGKFYSLSWKSIWCKDQTIS